MTLFTVFLLAWYGLQFVEAWVYAGAGEITTGKPVSTLFTLLGSAFLFFQVFHLTDGPLTWQGWVLAFYNLINVGGGFYYLVRGPKTDDWGVGSAVVVTFFFAGILSLWFTGVLV